MRYLIVLLTLLPIRVLALELSVEDRACITAAAAKLPPVAALKIEDSRVVSQPPPQGQRNSNPYHVKVEIDVSVAGQTSTYVYNCIRDGQLTVIQPLGMTRRTPESGGVASPRPRPAVVSRQADGQSSQQAYSGNSGGNYPNLNIRSFGAMGDGNSHPLSSIYPSLAAAQAVYPFVSDLTQEVDWAATQLAIDTGFANAVNSAYCPAVTAQNASYRLSNPIVIDKPHNTRGSYPAWNSRTTYGYDPNGSNRVTYNGLPWNSLGSGNIGNPPTSASGYPANLSIAGSNLPYATVTVTSASPAVVTLNKHGFYAGQPLIFLAQTYSNQNITSPALPSGISANTVYYVLSTGLTTNTFEISATPGGTATNTSSTGSGAITVTTQIWGFDPNGGPSFSDRTNFIGDDGAGATAEGCRFNSPSYTTIAFMVGPNNGNLIKNLTVFGPGQNGGQNIYRCQMPTGLVGIGNVSNGGGTSNTQYINLGIDGFYTASRTNYEGGGTLGDQNTWWKPRLADACEGVNINSQENFVNTIYEGEIGGVTNSAISILGAGLDIFGGNYSTSSSQTNTFSIASVTSPSSSCSTVCLQAIVTNPDDFLNHPMCGYNLQCVYTKFAIVTPNFGNLPLDLDGYNPSTGIINLHVDSEWMSLWHNTCCGTVLMNDITAATTLYAAEVITVFNGEGMIVTGVHVENTVPTTLASSGQRFGGPLPMQLTNFNIAWGVTLGDNICCNNAGPTSNQIANFYIQDNLDFIGASLDMVLDGINGAGGNNNAWDRALVGVGGGGAQRGRLEFRHVMPITTGAGAQVGIMEFNFRNNSATFGNQFDTSIYYGSQGFGLGEANNGGLTESYAVTTADLWRAQGIGSSPFWGVRPASYAMPCITPAQVTALASPAAITWTATLQYAPISAAGSKYQVGDTLTVSGGTASTAATINVDAVNGSGGITLAHVTNPGVNSYTAEPSAPVSVTGGHGLGAQFGVANVFGGSTVSKILWWYVNYSVAYPMLWGGTIYHVCDYKGGSRTKYALESTNLGYSYFQNLTTTNVPNLNWRSHDSSPVIWMNPEALELMFPGLAFSLTPTAGTTGCTSAGTETFMVTEVHPTAGYVIVVNAGQNGSPYLPQWGNGLTCTGTTIGQARANIVNPF